MKNSRNPKTSISHIFAEFRRGECRIAHARTIFTAAIRAVDSCRAVCDTVKREDNVLRIQGRDAQTASYNLDRIKRIFVIGCGKGSAPMAAAMEDILRDRITAGMVVVKRGHTLPQRTLDRIKIIEAGHPEPDARGMKAARAIRGILKRAESSDLVIALVSGGGSALLPLPAPGISLGDLVRMTRLLIGCGADIGEINTIRKHLSAIQGGRAARLVFPAQVMVFIISDVINDDFHTIASGPFIGDPGTFKDAWDIVQKYQLEKAAPRRIIRYLRRNLRSIKAETPKPGDPVFRNIRHVLCASNSQSLAAAAAMAEKLGYVPNILDAGLSGDVRRVARNISNELIRLKEAKHDKPRCAIWGGETTVLLDEYAGKGGRNQELALSSAFYLQGYQGITVLSASTDGNDGPTDATGAIVDGTTIMRCRMTKIDPQRALLEHNAYPLLDQIGALIKTGPTNTNVMDVIVGLVD